MENILAVLAENFFSSVELLMERKKCGGWLR
jgi:hypothetical protein